MGMTILRFIFIEQLLLVFYFLNDFSIFNEPSKTTIVQDFSIIREDLPLTAWYLKRITLAFILECGTFQIESYLRSLLLAFHFF